MAKFIGNIIIALAVAGGTMLILKSLPDLARYLKLREM